MAIKYVHNDEEEYLEFDGMGIDLLAEVSWFIRKVYLILRKKSPNSANAFKTLLIKVIGSPDSPTWE